MPSGCSFPRGNRARHPQEPTACLQVRQVVARVALNMYVLNVCVCEGVTM